jgi:predicted DNA-binding transcriptional regulator AlpA
VADMIGMSRRWVYETFSVPARGGIKPMKFGHVSKWYRWEVQTWVAEKHRAASR